MLVTEPRRVLVTSIPGFLNMERVAGIEPATTVWKSVAQPLKPLPGEGFAITQECLPKLCLLKLCHPALGETFNFSKIF